MTFTPRLASLILPCLLLLQLPARADDIQVGTGLVCDTQEQAERFATLYDGDTETAIGTINAEEHNATACAVVTMTYMPGPPLATVRKSDMTLQVVPIVVLGLVTPDGIQAVEPARFFSVQAVEGYEI
jgi:hypothetical protein